MFGWLNRLWSWASLRALSFSFQLRCPILILFITYIFESSILSTRQALPIEPQPSTLIFLYFSYSFPGPEGNSMLSSIDEYPTRPLNNITIQHQLQEVNSDNTEMIFCSHQKLIFIDLYCDKVIIMEESKDILVKSLKPQQLKEIILDNQSKEEKGYYTKQEWGELHESLLGVERTILPVLNVWRLLKLINFGDDYVPTGLVYDTLITLLDQERSVDQAEALLKSIFFKFIEFNGKFLSSQEREELAFFRVIRSAIEGYRQILQGTIQPIEGSLKDRYEQLYQLHNVFTYRKNLEALKRIEDQFKNCKFQPEVNQRISEMVQSRYMEPKINHQLMKQEQERYENHVIDEEEEFQDSFRANPVPAYPEITPVGVSEHLIRMQKSREIKRISNLKPYRSVNQSAEIAPFSLVERSQARKERTINNYKLLFFIKVEVGKRVFRVKVRENMSIEDVVRNIELMVGFKDESLHEIVRNYFANYEKRQKQKEMIIEEY